MEPSSPRLSMESRGPSTLGAGSCLLLHARKSMLRLGHRKLALVTRNLPAIRDLKMLLQERQRLLFGRVRLVRLVVLGRPRARFLFESLADFGIVFRRRVRVLILDSLLRLLFGGLLVLGWKQNLSERRLCIHGRHGDLALWLRLGRRCVKLVVILHNFGQFEAFEGVRE